MATIVSRRTLPRQHRHVGGRTRGMSSDGSFFRGVAFALPIGLLVWFTLIWAIRAVI